MIAHAGASVLDVIAMTPHDFYQENGEYWVNISGKPPVHAAPDLETSVQDYLACRQAGGKTAAFLFTRGEVRSLTPSDVHEIFRRYRNKAKWHLHTSKAHSHK